MINYKRAMYFLTPHHGNAGDNLQAYCIQKMLQKFFGIENVLKFNMQQTDEGIKQVTSDDIVFMSSGGNLGDLWPGGETNRRKIILGCPNNIIVSFPQTIHFDSKQVAEESSRVYKAHSNLYIFARDPKSYSIAKTLFPTNQVQQLPDPVFTLSHSRNFERKGILCIFRTDKENNLSDDEKNQIVNHCKQISSRVDVVDTGLSIPVIEEKISQFLDKISGYQAVVTNRFHGAIFAGITGTPCFAFPTIDHKITESIYWHKRFRTKFTFCKDILKFTEQIQNISKPFIYDPSEAIELYHRVISAVKMTGMVPDINPVSKVILSRRTVRKWQEADLPENILMDIIKMGIYAPSGSNAQCTKFKIIQDKQKISAICKECFKRDSDYPSAVIMVGYDFGIEKTINFNHKNIVWETLKYQDVAAAIQNMQLYCESIGLTCCWLSFFTNPRQKFLNELDIKDSNIEYLSAVAVGFTKDKSTPEIEHSHFMIIRKDVKEYLI